MNGGKPMRLSSCLLLLVGFGLACASGPKEAPLRESELPSRQPEGMRTERTSRAVSYEAAHRDNLIHGIAGDEALIFVTEPLAKQVAVLDRFTGKQVASLPHPEGEGLVLPFTLRVPKSGHLVVLDAGGFPSPTAQAIPRVYDYAYSYEPRGGGFTARITRTVRFDGHPVAFSEDLEVLSNGSYVMSESVFGGLWVIRPDGTIAPGVVPESPDKPLPALGPCPLANADVDGIPFKLGFGPGVGSLAERDGQLYFGSTCRGGIHRIPVASLLDGSRTPVQRAQDIQTVSPRPEGTAVETLKGLAFNRFNPADRWLYVGDPFRLRLLRVDVTTGERQVVGEDPRLFNFSVATAFLPPVHGDESPLVVSSDQEHRLAALNPGIAQDQFQAPFVVTKVFPKP